MVKPNFASTTEELCKCGFLEDAASGYYDAQLGYEKTSDGPTLERAVRFDPSTNEFTIHAGGMAYRIYHCLFCGGAAPAALPRTDYATITYEEEARIASVMDSIRSLEEAQAKLGQPDTQDVDVRIYKEADGKQKAERLRQLVYKRLSPLAEVWITENSDRTIAYALQSKRIDDSKLFDWSTVPRHLRPDYLPAWKKLILRLIGVRSGVAISSIR